MKTVLPERSVIIQERLELKTVTEKFCLERMNKEII